MLISARWKSVKYITPRYNYMIQKGMVVAISIVDAEKCMCWDRRKNCKVLLKNKETMYVYKKENKEID